MPDLNQEMRAINVVTDIFGLRRRDYEQFDSSPNRSTVTSSLFSSYFCDSTPSLFDRSSISSVVSSKSLPNSPAKKSSSNPNSRPRSSSGSACSSTRSTSASTDISQVSRYPASSKYGRAGSGSSGVSDSTDRALLRRLSIASSDSSSTTHSDSDVSFDGGSTSSTNPAIVDDAPYVFGHNPQHSDERPSSVLELLPEDREMLSKSSEGFLSPSIIRRPRASTIERRANRSCQIVGSIVNRDSGKLEKPKDDPSIRESWQTCSSMDLNANEIVKGLGFTMPTSVKEIQLRASMASILTFMTTDSAEAVIPRTPTTPSPNDRRSTASRPQPSTTISLSDFEIYSDYDDDINSILDSFPRPTSYLHECPFDLPETPTGHEYPDAPRSPNSIQTSFNPPLSPTLTSKWFFTTLDSPDSLRTSFDRPPSPTCTIGTVHPTWTLASSKSPGSISLKATYKNAFIPLRAPREISFAEVRQRLYNNFVAQEGVPLSHDFIVAFVPATQSPTQPSPCNERLRFTPTSSTDREDLIIINCDTDWEHLISSAVGSELTLRILDPK